MRFHELKHFGQCVPNRQKSGADGRMKQVVAGQGRFKRLDRQSAALDDLRRVDECFRKSECRRCDGRLSPATDTKQPADSSTESNAIENSPSEFGDERALSRVQVKGSDL